MGEPFRRKPISGPLPRNNRKFPHPVSSTETGLGLASYFGLIAVFPVTKAKYKEFL